MIKETADIAIIGAGSAGSVLANRLSADGKTRVLLLEAGPRDRNPWLSIPAGFTRVFFHDTLNWGYATAPEPHLDNRAIYWPRGRVLGGSSAINAMVYMRGHARDYDDWAAAGNAGWAWREVLPYFRKSERSAGGSDAAHGRSGEMIVSEADFIHPASEAFVAAACAAGLPRNHDFDAGDQTGAGFLRFTIRDGRRVSAASAFLKPANGRPNLRIVTDAHVERIRLEGRRAIGLVYRHGAQTVHVEAGQIVLCAGAVNTPHLLMLSGIGPADELRAAGVIVRHELPGVGSNLQDHLYISLSVRAQPEGSINARLRGLGLAREVLTYVSRRRGVLALGASQASAFAQSTYEQDRPDLQINFTPLSFTISPQKRIAVDDHPGFTLALAHLRPQSRGRIGLSRSEPAGPPEIQANYLAEETDRLAVCAGMRLIQRIAAQEPLARLIAGPAFPDLGSGAAEVMRFVRANAGSLFHPVGTCRMGQDRLAVVDARLRVHGVEGLRIADASIMPTIVTGNTNAPSIMIGEKAADMIREDLGLG